MHYPTSWWTAAVGWEQGCRGRQWSCELDGAAAGVALRSRGGWGLGWSRFAELPGQTAPWPAELRRRWPAAPAPYEGAYMAAWSHIDASRRASQHRSTAPGVAGAATPRTPRPGVTFLAKATVGAAASSRQRLNRGYIANVPVHDALPCASAADGSARRPRPRGRGPGGLPG